jgi:hypothetical protein
VPPPGQCIEDLAESFSGFEYIGHPRSALTLLSFGSIKIQTGFGCGIARVRDAHTAQRMRTIQVAWPVQTRWRYASKCAKTALAQSVLNVPAICWAFISGGRVLGQDHKALMVHVLRGFPDRLMERLREQPCAAQLTMLWRRLNSFDVASFQRQQDRCDLMLELCAATTTTRTDESVGSEGGAAGEVDATGHVCGGEAACVPSSTSCSTTAAASPAVPGVHAPVRNYWLYPILVGTPGVDSRAVDVALRMLNQCGVDAYRGATQLALVPLPPESDIDAPFPVRCSPSYRT